MSPARHPAYRQLLRLYPRSFRAHHADDLVQHLDDLVIDRGRRAAWARTALDLAVTIPRYRLEPTMSERSSAAVLVVALTGMALVGVLGLLTGVYPAMLLVPAALAIGLAQRSSLARAVRTPDASRRRRRLQVAAVLGVVFVGAALSWMRAVDQRSISDTSILLHNAVGVTALVGAVAFLIAGLLTPKADPAHP